MLFCVPMDLRELRDGEPRRKSCVLLVLARGRDGGVVGADRNRDTVLQKREDRMLLSLPDRTGLIIGRDTAFDQYPIPCQPLEQLLVLDRRAAVTDPANAQLINRFPDAFRPFILAGMHRKPQFSLSCDAIGLFEKSGRV